MKSILLATIAVAAVIVNAKSTNAQSYSAGYEPIQLVEPSGDVSSSANAIARKITHSIRGNLSDARTAVIPLGGVQLSQSEVQFLTEEITNALVVNGLRLVERSQLSKVLKELQLVETGLIDERSAARVGRMIGARFVMVGTLTRIGEGIRLQARLVEVETAEIVGAVSYTIPRTDALISLGNNGRTSIPPTAANDWSGPTRRPESPQSVSTAPSAQLLGDARIEVVAAHLNPDGIGSIRATLRVFNMGAAPLSVVTTGQIVGIDDLGHTYNTSSQSFSSRALPPGSSIDLSIALVRQSPAHRSANSISVRLPLSISKESRRVVQGQFGQYQFTEQVPTFQGQTSFVVQLRTI